MPVDTVREFLRARPWTASYDPGVPADLDLPETSLVHMLERSVARHGASTSLEFFGATTSYAALGRQVDRAAEGLRRLAGDGDLRSRLALAARARIEAEFSFRRRMERMTEVYELLW